MGVQLAAEATSFGACAATADFTEGVAAFLGKRPPRFGGRSDPQMATIRHAVGDDFPAIWAIFQPTVAAADTYAYAPNTTRAQARRIWMEAPLYYVAEDGGHVVGTYTLRPNQRGLGDHYFV